VNDAYRLLPSADVIYFADAKWWEWHKHRPAYRYHPAERCTIYSTGNMVSDSNVHMLRNAGQSGISTNAGELCTGQNSGYQAVNLAVLAGASRIVLVGYDAQPAADGRKHFFGDHPDKTAAPYPQMLVHFRAAAPLIKALGVEVLNASPDSAIDCFRRVPLADAIHP
jgi:hypothetical protein